MANVTNGFNYFRQRCSCNGELSLSHGPILARRLKEYDSVDESLQTIQKIIRYFSAWPIVGHFVRWLLGARETRLQAQVEQLADQKIRQIDVDLRRQFHIIFNGKAIANGHALVQECQGMRLSRRETYKALLIAHQGFFGPIAVKILEMASLADQHIPVRTETGNPKSFTFRRFAPSAASDRGIELRISSVGGKVLFEGNMFFDLGTLNPDATTTEGTFEPRLRLYTRTSVDLGTYNMSLAHSLDRIY